MIDFTNDTFFFGREPRNPLHTLEETAFVMSLLQPRGAGERSVASKTVERRRRRNKLARRARSVQR